MRDPAPGATGEAVIAYRDLTPGEPLEVKFANVGWRAVVNLQAEHLVEVAIVQSAVPADGKCVTAHNVKDSGWVERRSKVRHVVGAIRAHSARISLDIISCRSGDAPTWQWRQVRLHRRVMFN